VPEPTGPPGLAHPVQMPTWRHREMAARDHYRACGVDGRGVPRPYRVADDAPTVHHRRLRLPHSL